MTRLYWEIIKDIPGSLPALDQAYLSSTGHKLLGLAALTIPVSYAAVEEKIKNRSASIVSISSGEGVIPGFVDCVKAVLEHIGMKTRITEESDVAGFGEAFNSEADVLFAADDCRFLAFSLHTRRVIDNAWATANGFAQALAAAVEMRDKGLAGQKVLVLGLGPVGIYGVQALLKAGAQVWVFDINAAKLKKCIEEHGNVQAAGDLETALRTIDYVLDATPAAGIIGKSMIRPTTIISCPGVPHGLTSDARTKIGARFIHDNLPLGVAVMALHSM